MSTISLCVLEYHIKKGCCESKIRRHSASIRDALTLIDAALELANAQASVEGSALLTRGVGPTGIPQRELAERVGVIEDRVSQVLGEGGESVIVHARSVSALPGLPP